MVQELNQINLNQNLLRKAKFDFTYLNYTSPYASIGRGRGNGFFNSLLNVREIVNLFNFGTNKNKSRGNIIQTIERINDSIYECQDLPKESSAYQHYETRDFAKISMNMMKLSFELLNYKENHGDYPASLLELEEHVGEELRIDPFSGQHYGYQNNEQQTILYSVGRNLHDDGGQPEEYKEFENQEYGQKQWQWVGDNVWPLPQ